MSGKQIVQDRRQAGVRIDKPFRKHKLVSVVERHWRVRREDVRDGDRSSTANTCSTVYEDLCTFVIDRPKPLHSLGNEVAVNGVVCSVAHRYLVVDDWGVVVAGIGRRVDHVKIVGDIEHVRESQLDSVRRRDEVAEVNGAADVIVIWTLPTQHQVMSNESNELSSPWQLLTKYQSRRAINFLYQINACDQLL